MKRRTKLTPFAKIVFLAFVFLGARYAYLHQNEILEMEFLKSKDTTEIVLNKDTVVFDSEGFKKPLKDTIDLYLTRINNSIRIQTSDTIVEISEKDTLIFTVSEKDNIIGRIILN